MRRYNNALMVLAVEWGKEAGLFEESTVWYKAAWKKGTVIEKPGKKLVLDFEYRMRKTTTTRRPDLTLEDAEECTIWLVDMACPGEANIAEKRRKKLQKYQQLAFEIRESRVGFIVKIVPLVIGCLGRGMVKLEEQIKKLIKGKSRQQWVVREMRKTVLIKS